MESTLSPGVFAEEVTFIFLLRDTKRSEKSEHFKQNVGSHLFFQHTVASS